MSRDAQYPKRGGLKRALKYKINAFKEFWNEYRRFKIGLAGLALLFILIGMAVAADVVVPADIRTNWATNPRWVDNPKLAPPAWINWFSSIKYLEPTDLKPVNVDEYWKVCYAQKIAENKELLDKLTPEQREKALAKFEDLCRQQYVGYYFEFVFNNQADKIGKELMIIIRNLKYPATITLDIYRPDGVNLTGIEVAELTPTNESKQKLQFSESLMDVVVRELVEPIDGPEAATDLMNKLKNRAFSVVPFILLDDKPGISNGTTETVKGEYRFVISVTATQTNLTESQYVSPEVEIRFPGACYGVLGTDLKGRDNFITIMLGSQLALLLGFTYSVAAVIIGVIYGATSGYLRGSGRLWADEALQRVNEVIYSLPVLPFLIIFSYYLRLVYKIQPNIFHIAGLLLIFGWTGVAIVTRSMALSVMGQPYIESAVALGAKGRRILFKYVLPQLVPYAFAAIALSIPGAILMEAGLSFLGLTDPNMPSWGRMLYEAQNAIKAWWWVLPPGVMITIAAVAFAFIGTALDTIVNPKLKGL